MALDPEYMKLHNAALKKQGGRLKSSKMPASTAQRLVQDRHTEEQYGDGGRAYSPPSGHTKHLADHERAHTGQPGSDVDHGKRTMDSHQRIAKMKGDCCE